MKSADFAAVAILLSLACALFAGLAGTLAMKDGESGAATFAGLLAVGWAWAAVALYIAETR